MARGNHRGFHGRGFRGRGFHGRGFHGRGRGRGHSVHPLYLPGCCMIIVGACAFAPIINLVTFGGSSSLPYILVGLAAALVLAGVIYLVVIRIKKKNQIDAWHRSRSGVVAPVTSVSSAVGVASQPGGPPQSLIATGQPQAPASSPWQQSQTGPQKPQPAADQPAGAPSQPHRLPPIASDLPPSYNDAITQPTFNPTAQPAVMPSAPHSNQLYGPPQQQQAQPPTASNTTSMGQ
ncbi:hypothetical protein CAPTEDRAFT_190704 [Capitella teleta]|uniref:Uncharacterized protein n=1 Tax=Capitella teleta TaxID=283909 RepID=R7TYG0_CAPTE|nr:hypothetical protein CAPTEDRAFT_190704 [Capitella teleta]|eukprot:ELT96461.1 hypothetical protein CAPTEDRAFT_190704 [Capitella teleta]